MSQACIEFAGRKCVGVDIPEYSMAESAVPGVVLHREESPLTMYRLTLIMIGRGWNCNCQEPLSGKNLLSLWIVSSHTLLKACKFVLFGQARLTLFTLKIALSQSCIVDHAQLYIES